MDNSSSRKRIAVVGAGIAGLGAAWALARRHAVTLYEQAPRCGGHANTVEIDLDGSVLPVDTGFIVYNARNYPHLVALFDHLDVPTTPSDMSFAVSLDGGRVEYAGSDLNGLFAQRRNTLRPRFWRMLHDIQRFYRHAPRYLERGLSGLSIGALLDAEGYSSAFVEDHLVPMAAAIWSASRADIRQYPADAFIRFFDNHGLLTLTQRPQWRTVSGGSREYVSRLLADVRLEARLAARVARLERSDDGVRVIDAQGHAQRFDDVVVATHADEALALLGDAGADEREVLGAVHYSDNVAWLHEDPAHMPRRRAAWSSWNYMHDARLGEARPLSVSYWMNRLQPLATRRDLIVTLNPLSAPRAVHGRFEYTHPIFNRETAAAQRRSLEVQGRRRTWFCGAWLGHGFHEDGLQSGLWVAEQLGAAVPWRDSAGFDRLPDGYGAERSRAA